jgi:predicted N-acyltransferase
MPDESEMQLIKILSGIKEINSDNWNACAGDDDPFISHAFLAALEESGSVSADSGWMPQHLIIEDENTNALAVAPLYLKNHSYGEYVFDSGWANALQQAGGEYYPKLQVAVPFTPVTGKRLLVRQDLTLKEQDILQRALLSGLIQLAERHKISSFHITFPSKQEWQLCGELGLLQRTDRQFHWMNDGFNNFDEFLSALSSRKRKGIRKERRAISEKNVVIWTLNGDQIEERHWDAFYSFYKNTSDRKWGQAYLNRKFFSLLGESMRQKILLIIAEFEGRFVGGALNMIGSDTLYGRYWGCLEDFKFLHFEVCYYQAMDFAIKTGLTRVEAGAQGHHKLQRGYLPTATYSAHWIANAGFREAVERYLVQETGAINDEIDYLGDQSPFKRS